MFTADETFGPLDPASHASTVAAGPPAHAGPDLPHATPAPAGKGPHHNPTAVLIAVLGASLALAWVAAR